MNWLLKVLVLAAYFQLILSRGIQFNRVNNQNDLIRQFTGDEIAALCTQCCNAGDYSHGNEKCGLALDSQNFAFNLMRSLTSQSYYPQNVVLSPFSVMNMMMLLSLGASGSTREEIRRALSFPLYFPPSHDHVLMKCALMRYDGVSLHAANAVFYDNDKASSKESFITEAARYYNVSVQGVRFEADPYHAWLNVSEFIKETTRGFLDSDIQEGSISELLFVNTVYFNGTWNFKVEEDATKRITFYRNFRSARQVEAFEVKHTLNVGVIEDYIRYGDKIRVVELPYVDTQFSMFIFKSEMGILSMNFIEEVINRWTIWGLKDAKMHEQYISVTIPKFSITYQSDISQALIKMGVRKLFGKSRDNDDSELDNLFENNPNISADRLLHSAKIMVTEAGTQAAAASLSWVNRAGHTNLEKITFSHPFVFVIYDSCNNLILFQGRCVDPQ